MLGHVCLWHWLLKMIKHSESAGADASSRVRGVNGGAREVFGFCLESRSARDTVNILPRYQYGVHVIYRKKAG